MNDTLSKKILDALEKYQKLFRKSKILKTMEEVEANTNNTNLVAAPVVGELINSLTFPDGTKFYHC